MTATAQQLLHSFDALPDAEKHQVAIEILRRFPGAVEGDLPESALVEAADELFRTLDANEAGHGPCCSRLGLDFRFGQTSSSSRSRRANPGYHFLGHADNPPPNAPTPKH
jgi:hypothetical protein